MRLKTTPDDFIVREATDLRIGKKPAEHRVYMLEKSGWNTPDALMRIARAKGVPYSRFAYGGKKDRHAHTFQYVTVAHPADLSYTTTGYSLKALGYSHDPMAPYRILVNHFELTLREMKEAEVAALLASQERTREGGAPNYFDDQRFGTFDRERGFVAEKMLQRRWEEALNIALTGIYSEESREAKERKRALRERWGDWAACRALAETALEQRSFDLLLTNPAGFRQALATVNSEIIGVWLTAYQAYLWNEILRRWLTAQHLAATSIPGSAGPYLFAADTAPLRDLVIPLPGKGMRFDRTEVGYIFEEILAERRLRPAVLEEEILPDVVMRASPRSALVLPQGLHVEPTEPDDRYPDHRKMALRFALPRGSYATMLVKAFI